MSLKKTLLFTDANDKPETEEEVHKKTLEDAERKRPRDDGDHEEEDEDDSTAAVEGGDPFLRESTPESERDFKKRKLRLPDEPAPTLKDAAPCRWKHVFDTAQLHEVWKFTMVHDITHVKETFLAVILDKTEPWQEMCIRPICGSEKVMGIYSTGCYDEGFIFPHRHYEHIGAEHIE